MTDGRFLAFDLGAESGRAVVGTLVGGRLSLDEIHRFPNEPVEVCGTLHWDILALYNNILKGMRTYVKRFGGSVDGIGIDTWGVDFGLLGRDGSLLQNPVHYRDRRIEGMAEEVNRKMSESELYERTGMDLLPVCTLYQLVSLRVNKSPVLESAGQFLMTPDLLGYFLTGRKRCERTIAISSLLYDFRTGGWHREIFETFDLPLSIMPELVDPGSVLGELRKSVRRATGMDEAAVIAVCSHDTASAVAAVPGTRDDWAFISSGTWSVLGSLTEGVATSNEALSAHMSNELTLQSFFLCRNIMGLWLLQQARAAWERQGESYSYADLVRLAESAPEGGPVVNPNDASFIAPEDMCKTIRDYCRRTGQAEPQGPAETTRCLLESLALCYRHALKQLAHIMGRRFNVLHIVGGGSQNTLLCRLTADATGIPVMAGPVEATASGNVLVQAFARGCLGSAQEVRDIVRGSFKLVEYQPGDTARWEDGYARYLRLVERTES